MADNRFAISLLPKSRKGEAFNGEVLINRDTGEIVVKSDSGIITSYDKNNRKVNHIKDFTNNGYSHNVDGDMYDIILDDRDMPCPVNEIASFISAPIQIAEQQMTKFMLSLDADKLLVDGSSYAEIDANQLLVSYDVRFFENETHSTYYGISGTLPLSQLTNTVFEVNYPDHVGDTVNFKVKLNSLSVTRNSIDSPTDDYIFIVHSILAILLPEVV